MIDETDTHQRLAGRPLRSLKPEGVLQELYALLIAHYAIRSLMHEAAVQAHLDPDRLSFTHAINVLQAAIPEFQMTALELLPRLYERLLHDLTSQRLPEGRLRTNPRVVKRKMSKFRLKRPEHFAWPQPSVRSFREAVALKVKGIAAKLDVTDQEQVGQATTTCDRIQVYGQTVRELMLPVVHHDTGESPGW